MWTARLPGKKASVTALAFSPDGGTIYSGDSHGTLLAWDVKAQSHRQLWHRPLPAPRYGIYRLWPTADGAHLYFRDDKQLFDALHLTKGPLLRPEEGDRYELRYVTPNGRYAITCDTDYRVGLWDLTDGRRRATPAPLGDETNVTHHVLLPDGITLLTYQSADNGLRLWDLRTGEVTDELTPRGDGIIPCALSQNGSVFAIGRNQTIWVHDMASRSLRHKMKFEKEIRQLAIQPDGKLIASASTNSVVTLWDATTGEQLKQFDWQAGKVEALAFSPDGLTCISGGKEMFVAFDVNV